jgi:hypothetical protein
MRLKEENAELKARVGEMAGIESGKKKAENRIVILEEKVRLGVYLHDRELKNPRWTR